MNSIFPEPMLKSFVGNRGYTFSSNNRRVVNIEIQLPRLKIMMMNTHFVYSFFLEILNTKYWNSNYHLKIIMINSILILLEILNTKR